MTIPLFLSRLRSLLNAQSITRVYDHLAALSKNQPNLPTSTLGNDFHAIPTVSISVAIPCTENNDERSGQHSRSAA